MGNAIARYVMQGPRQAMTLAVVFAAIPLLYWVSAAVVALVILRQGLSQGINVLLAALLPGVAWYAAQQEITVFIVVLGTALMAVTLRISVSLPRALVVSVLTGLSVVFLLASLSPEWYGLLEKGAQEYADSLAERAPEASTTLTPWILPMLVGGIGAFTQLFAIGGLLVARNWQAQLFNPGGFSEEFHQLRLPLWYGALVMVFTLIGSSSPAYVGLVPVLLVPLFIGGISLIHGVVAIKQLSGQWLFAFYLSLLFFLPYMYALLILIALLDMLIDIRKRLDDTAK